jgi:hypothetical protein
MALHLLGDVLERVDLLDPRIARDHPLHHAPHQPVPSRHGVHWPQLSCL